MSRRPMGVLTGLCALMLIIGASESTAGYGAGGRAGRFDVFLLWERMSGEESSITMDYNAPPVPGEYDGTLEAETFNTYGIGLGYNITAQLNVNTAFRFGSIKLETGDADHQETHMFESRDDHDVLMGDLNLDYYFMPQAFSPLISGGIGLMKISGDFDDLHNRVDFDVEGTNLTCNLGLGFRWDMAENILLKGIYKNTWTKLENTEDRMRMRGWAINLGMMF